MRGRLEDIRALGAELVIVGNGAASFASGFREEFALDDVTVLIDPKLAAYRSAGLRRGRLEALSPRVPLHTMRALRNGFRQTAVRGDPWQLGGVFVVQPGGAVVFRHVSREAGDHPDLDEVLAAIPQAVRGDAGPAPPGR